jgi:hypothetical protein
MNDPKLPPAATPRCRQGFWLTVGEIVAALALVVAGLNYWDTHRARLDQTRQAENRARAEAAFVAVGVVDRAGRAISLQPLGAGQVVLSQRYVFPSQVLNHAMEITAARPQIDLGWIEGGLRHALETARVKGDGEARLPVVIETTYVEDGDTRADRSLYQIGYSWRRRFLGGLRIQLQGIALARRGVVGDPRRLANARWAPPNP